MGMSRSIRARLLVTFFVLGTAAALAGSAQSASEGAGIRSAEPTVSLLVQFKPGAARDAVDAAIAANGG